MPRAPWARGPAASASHEQGSSLLHWSGERGASAENGPAEDCPAEFSRQQHREASGADLEAAPAGAPLARACDDYDDCDGELDELDAAGTGAPQARLLGVAGASAPGRALLNGSPLAAPSTEPESITSRDSSKEGVLFFVKPRACFDV